MFQSIDVIVERLAVLGLQLEVVLAEHAAAAPQVGLQLVRLDGVGHAPHRLEDDGLQRAREDGRLLARLADDDALRMDAGVVLDEIDHELGHVGHDMHLPQIVGHPAPLFHVGEDLPGERLALVREVGLPQLLELRLLGVQPAHVGGRRRRPRRRP